jgi:long-subunit acyl-CoA synthetase (AMP-forming)
MSPTFVLTQLSSQGYGLTETSPVVHIGLGERLGWCGRLIPTWEARLVTDEGEDAAPGGRGELWVRGPSVMKGYHNNPEATEKTMAPGGWFKTGDVLVRDSEDGFFK